MYKSQLAIELKNRLTLLLNNPAFVKSQWDHAGQSQSSSEILAEHNRSVSEEIMNYLESSANDIIQDHIIDTFRAYLSAYLKEKGTGNIEYDEYITIICEYQALVANQALHPIEVRHFKKEPPEDTDDLKYCCWKSQYIKETGSLCRFCNCLPWPDKRDLGFKTN